MFSHPTSRYRYAFILFCACFTTLAHAFHDCIEQSRKRRQKRKSLFKFPHHSNFEDHDGFCKGGICIGMKNGPHEGGNASYPVHWNGTAATSVYSEMTVPDYPAKLDGITYYIWTDIFFGDAGHGRMNQFVPQLILGSTLDGSSGPPNYIPKWGRHTSYLFGAHYFFELFNTTTNATDGHAAYGDLYPAQPGETLFTYFHLGVPPVKDNTKNAKTGSDQSPIWTLTMGVVNDPTRTSTLKIEKPYMGMGVNWEGDLATSRWDEASYHNMCINACWELYGADDVDHLPSSGATYNMWIEQPKPKAFEFTTWEQDEGNDKCPSCAVDESRDDQVQKVHIQIYTNATHKNEDAEAMIM